MNPILAESGRRISYVITSLALILSQHGVAWSALRYYDEPTPLDMEFWLTPLRSVLEIGGLPALPAAAIFAYFLVIAWALALLSFRTAQRTNRGYVLAALSLVPVVQLRAILLNALLPSRRLEAEDADGGGGHRQAVIGLLAGIALIVLAVLVSAVTFGAYGWGLFVMTPFLVGVTTAYLVNERGDIGFSETMKLVFGAAGLGSLALVVLALEGIMCIFMAAPLAIPVVLLGGAIGRGVALARHNRRNPLVSVAVLPILFMTEAAMPPEVPIATQYEIDIGASPEAVWRALTSPDPIAVEPGLPALAGLAYPLSGELETAGVGAKRVGAFSTGTAIEHVTAWEPNKTLAFRVESQPPAMEEMSPYRRVHAPHVEGYFLTGETRFELAPISERRTRLKVISEHRLRIDPVPYWEPIARLAIRLNVGRVLEDIKQKSEELN